MIKLELWTRFAFRSACVAVIILGLDDLNTTAQSHNPAVLPLVTQEGISYVGGFRVPQTAINGTDFIYGGSPIAFNPANNSLFAGSLHGRVAEITIPTPVNSADAKTMPVAAYVQPAFVDPTEGRWSEVSANSEVHLYGLLVYGNRLHGAMSIYYDANNNQRRSHFARSLTLTQASFSGWSQLWQAESQGFVGGWMSHVPAEWQTKLGGAAITGQCCIPIISRTSYGPAAFAFNPALIGQPVIPVQPLVYYDAGRPTLGRWEDQNERFGMATKIGGVAIINGTRTALFVGTNGMGPACYGDGTADKAAADASLTDELCYDPTSSDKGTHAYPYRYQVWAYDLNDFAAVKDRAKRPWQVVPYGVWPLTFPTSAPQLIIGGVAYDAQRQLLYVSQRHADQKEFTSTPIIHAFKVNAITTR